MIDFMPKRKEAAVKSSLKKPNRIGTPLNCWIDPALMEAFELYCASTRRTKTAEVELALEERLRNAGFWPPKSNSN